MAAAAFDLSGTAHFRTDFRSSVSYLERVSHADRLATIRSTYEKYGVMVDTHTADGLKVALEGRAFGRAADDRAGNGAGCEVRRNARSKRWGTGLRRPAAMRGIENFAAACRSDGRGRGCGEALHRAATSQVLMAEPFSCLQMRKGSAKEPFLSFNCLRH
jgi:hypothetical protein